MKRPKLVALLAGLMVAIVPAAANAASPSGAEHAQTTKIQILGLNDFHGNLEPPIGSGGRIGGTEAGGNAGGVEYLATHVRALRATNPNTIVRLGRRPDWRDATRVGAVPRRADDRGLQRDGARLQRRGKPRVRRRRDRAAPDALRRLSPGGRLPGRRSVRRRDIRFPRGERRVQGHGRDDLPALRHPSLQRRKGGNRRHDARGHASIVSPAGISHVDFFDEAASVNASCPG